MDLQFKVTEKCYRITSWFKKKINSLWFGVISFWTVLFLYNFYRCFCILTETDTSQILKMTQKCFEESICLLKLVEWHKTLEEKQTNKSSLVSHAAAHLPPESRRNVGERWWNTQRFAPQPTTHSALPGDLPTGTALPSTYHTHCSAPPPTVCACFSRLPSWLQGQPSRIHLQKLPLACPSTHCLGCVGGRIKFSWFRLFRFYCCFEPGFFYC